MEASIEEVLWVHSLAIGFVLRKKKQKKLQKKRSMAMKKKNEAGKEGFDIRASNRAILHCKANPMTEIGEDPEGNKTCSNSPTGQTLHRSAPPPPALDAGL